MQTWFLLSVISTARHNFEVFSRPSSLTQHTGQLRFDECFGRFSCNDVCSVAPFYQLLNVSTIQLVDLPSFACGHLIVQGDKMELHDGGRQFVPECLAWSDGPAIK